MPLSNTEFQGILNATFLSTDGGQLETFPTVGEGPLTPLSHMDDQGVLNKAMGANGRLRLVAA